MNHCDGGEGLTFGNQTSFKKGHNAKPVIQLKLDGSFVKKWPSISHAEERFSGIWHCCSGKKKTAGGFIWVYEVDYISNPIESIVAKSKHVKLSSNSGSFKKGHDNGKSIKLRVTDIVTNISTDFENVSRASKYVKASSTTLLKYARLPVAKVFRDRYVFTLI